MGGYGGIGMMIRFLVDAKLLTEDHFHEIS